MRAGSRGGRVAAGIAILVALGGPAAAQAAPDTAIRYVYDEAGRLKAVSDPATQTATYRWDPVGNLLAIGRLPSSSTSVIQLAPSRGAVGSTVTILGTGFSTTASQNAVKFNGTSATVSSATKTELVVTVPSGATSGAVSVTAPGGTATSDAPFTVAGPDTPSITGVTPHLAAAGQSIAVSGARFETSIAANKVAVNQTRVDLASATASALDFKAPGATGSGPVSVATPNGKATGPDLFIPPQGYGVGDVAGTARTTLGSYKTINFTTAGKIALIAFDGQAGQVVSLKGTAVTASSYLSLIGPNGQELTGSQGYVGQDGDFTEGTELPTTGTYTILVRPNESETGSIRVTPYADGPHPKIVPTSAGAVKDFNLQGPGLRGIVRFDGSAGQRIAVRFS
ncbi:MAG TPA: IPT/TIG domain-containing protein, partial [Thermoleophilaceae bacterium]